MKGNPPKEQQNWFAYGTGPYSQAITGQFTTISLAAGGPLSGPTIRRPEISCQISDCALMIRGDVPAAHCSNVTRQDGE